jgi:ADP-ribose pyrophosphatase
LRFEEASPKALWTCPRPERKIAVTRISKTAPRSIKPGRGLEPRAGKENPVGADPEKIETIYDSRVFRLCREEVTLPNGITTSLDVIRHPGSSAIVPLFPDNQVVMIRQYRHSVRTFLWEIPAGTRDTGEDPLECAQRELIEEAGYRANRFEKLTEILPAPGYTDERIHIFLARGLEPVPQNLDRDEVLEVHRISLRETPGMIGDGRIQDALTIIGLLLVSMRVSPQS